MPLASRFEQLKAVDLRSLNEEERQSAIIEVRAQIDRIAKAPKDVSVLARGIVLLKIWQQLVQLRIDDVKANVAPPFVKPSVERMFTHPEPEVSEPPATDPVEATVEEPQAPAEGDGFVMVRLLEAGVVRGMKLPAGISIKTSQEDADHLVEAGKAIQVTPGDAAAPVEPLAPEAKPASKRKPKKAAQS